jgi:uncharacterized protein YbjQ (UPF0145 family)
VTGEAVVGTNLFRDLFAGIRDIVAVRAAAYEKELRKARDLAFEEIMEAAQELGANAIIGVDIDYEVLGEKIVVDKAGSMQVPMIALREEGHASVFVRESYHRGRAIT